MKARLLLWEGIPTYPTFFQKINLKYIRIQKKWVAFWRMIFRQFIANLSSPVLFGNRKQRRERCTPILGGTESHTHRNQGRKSLLRGHKSNLKITFSFIFHIFLISDLSFFFIFLF